MSMISVYNNGGGIPIKIHEDLNVHMPEMLFGQQLMISFIPDLKRFGMTELEVFPDGERIEVKKTIVDVEKLEDAKNAGTREAKNCTLVLTEGDSAKANALLGFDIIGRNNWGIYSLRGKLLNVHDASLKQISENKEVQVLERILGLQHDKQYNSINDYGKSMIMTDSSHIKGLIINFFDHLY